MKYFINSKIKIRPVEVSSISECLEFIEKELKKAGVSTRLAVRAEITSEEMLLRLIENSTGEGSIRIQIKRMFGDTVINMSVKGNEFDLYGGKKELSEDIEDIEDEDAQSVIRTFLLKANDSNLKYSHKDGVNSVRIMTGQSTVSSIKLTMGALALGILFGLILKFIMPEALCAGVCDYLLTPVSTVFMNALKIVIAPVVFFSIVTCISGFGDLSELGRIGARVMGMYLLTTVIAVVMSFFVTMLLSPGRFGAALAMQGGQAVDINTNVDTSLLNTIINIVPSNFIQPFLESDTLQLIFLAVVVGIAVGRIGEYTPVLSGIFEACNSLFLTVTSMIAKFIPAAVFCSISLMLVNLGGSSFLTMLGYFCTNVIEILIMMAIYGILVLVMARVNPAVFFRKIRQSMLTSFTLCSSSAAMPENLKTCTDKLGISPKVCNFSIPLGATINMDGTCISLVLTGLYLAKMYGVNVPGSALPALALTIILLSLGCPGVPGSGLVCLGIVLNQIGVPISAIGLVIAIDPVLDMFDTMSNTTGDIACATIVASKEGLLDRKILNDPEAV